MKVLLASHYLPSEQRGGVENYTARLATALRRTDEVVIVTGTGSAPTSDLWEEDGFEGDLAVHRMANRAGGPGFLDYRSARLDEAFEAYLRRTAPDVVHIQHVLSTSAGFIEVAHRLGIPTVVTLHDFWFLCSQIELLAGDSLCDGPGDGSKCATCPSIVGFSAPARIIDSLERRWLPDAAMRSAASAMARLVPRPLKRILKAKIVERHADELGGPSANAMRDRTDYLRRTLRLADLVLSPSRFLMDVFRKCGFEHPHFEYSDNGVPVAWLKQYRRTARSAGLRFACFSAVAPHKGIDLLVRAFRRLEDPEATLTLQSAGIPSFIEQIRALADGDARIRFMPPYDEDGMAAAYQSADVVVLPSIWYENSPLVIHEAALAGVPVIAADVGGMAEYVRHGHNGLLFRRGEPDSLLEALNAFVRDPSLAQHLTRVPFPLKSIEENADELRERYRLLVGDLRRSAGPATSPIARESGDAAAQSRPPEGYRK